MIPMDRRTFNGSLLSAAIGLGWARPTQAADDFGAWTVGIQSYTFREFKLEQALQRIAALGLRKAEFFRNHIPVESNPDQLKAILSLCKESGVAPISFGVENFTKNHDENKKKFEFAAAIGAKYLSADPNPDSLDSLDKLCEEYKIAIAIHPHGPVGKGMHRWSDAEMIMKAVQSHHPLIGTCLDTGHLIRSAQIGIKLDPVEQIKIMGKRNFGLHLKDHDNKKKVDVVFGDPTGVLDVVGVLKALKEVDFKGYIAIEYEHNPKDPSKDVKECLDYLKQSIQKVG
jgi:inosose dehydratase